MAGIADNNGNVASSSYFDAGVYFTGLTRDDIGGLRYLFTKINANVETLPADATAGTGGAWAPVGAAAGGSNNVVSVALRPGADKISFKRINYYGTFPAFTNRYTDSYYTNGTLVKQKIQRGLAQPDIVFAAGDLGTFGLSGAPIDYLRTTTAGWANNSALNSSAGAIVARYGPGVIQPGVVIAFSSIGPWIWNQFPGFMDQANQAGFFGGWAAIDGTTNAPFIFPNGATVKELMDRVLNAPPDTSGGTAWSIVGGTVTATDTTGGTRRSRYHHALMADFNERLVDDLCETNYEANTPFQSGWSDAGPGCGSGDAADLHGAPRRHEYLHRAGCDQLLSPVPE